jgi:hypothetical protein
MTDTIVKPVVLLLGSVILLAALYMQPNLDFTTMLGVHGLAVAIPTSLGFMLNDLEVNNLKGILSMLGVVGFGVALAGILTSIMLSAGVLFVVLSIVVIVALAYFD